MVRNPQKSYVVNGKFRLPKLPPNCFGLATSYRLTSKDIGRLEKSGALEEVMNSVGIGDRIDGSVYTVRNRPYAEYEAITRKQTSKEYDTCDIPDSGKPGTASRIEALQTFYEVEEQLTEHTRISPFTCDMAELVSKSAIGAAFEEYSHNEREDVA